MRLSGWGCLVLISHTDEIGSEFLDRVGRGTGLYRLRIMCDEEGLFRLYDDDSFSTLWCESEHLSFFASARTDTSDVDQPSFHTDSSRRP